MSISSNIQFLISLGGSINGVIPIAQLGNANSPGEHLSVALVNGANTLTPPTGATFLLIVPPATSTVTKTLKGISGDTGVPVSPSQIIFLALANTNPLVLTTNNTETIDLYWL